MSSMGAGNKLDASQFKVADIYKIQGMPVGQGYAPGTEEEKSQKIKGCLLGRTAETSD